MQDVVRLYPHVRRRNHMHRIRTTRRLQAMGVQHMFPVDFFVRHWRDQQNYFEEVLHLDYCPRCKLPQVELAGAICEQCSERNKSSWAAVREGRDRAIEQSMNDEPPISQDMIDIFRMKQAGDRGTPVTQEELTHTSETSVMDILAKARKQS